MFAGMSLPRRFSLPLWAKVNTSFRSLVAGVVALSVLIASVGVPVFLTPERTASQPHFCASHRCGCSQANAWTDCCCMTLAQKLEWAKEHGVTPPDDAVARAATSSQNQDSDEAAEAKGVTVRLVLLDDLSRCSGLASLWLTMGHALPPKVESQVSQFRPAPTFWVAETSQSAESLALSPATPPPRLS